MSSLTNKPRFTFGKAERLTRKKIFEEIFARGAAVHRSPVIAQFKVTELPDDVPVQVAFSVPKRRFKKAVHRNRLKRMMREAYRLNKHELQTFCEEHRIQCGIVLVYNSQELRQFNEIQEKIVLNLQEIMQRILNKMS